MTLITRNATLRRALNKGVNHKRGKVWYAIRTLRTFTAGDLLAVTEQSNRQTVLGFCGQLRHAGYLSVTYGARGEAHFRLVRDTGPQCPALVRNHTAIYDHNTATEYPLKGSSNAK